MHYSNALLIYINLQICAILHHMQKQKSIYFLAKKEWKKIYIEQQKEVYWHKFPATWSWPT